MLKEEFSFAKPTDTSRLFYMYMEKAKWFMDKGIDQWDVDYIRTVYTEDRILRHIENNNYFVLKISGEIVAACLFIDECDKWPTREPHCMFVDRLVSSKSGAGHMLLNYIIEYCKKLGVRKIKLDCQDHNDKLKKYYFDFGFIEAGTVEHKYFPKRYSCLMYYEIASVK